METDEKLQCHIAEDLLIPYIAGDVSPETRGWVDAHLEACPSCKHILGHMNRMAGVMRVSAPPLPADPGRRLLGRVRRDVRIVVAAVLALVLVLGALNYVKYSQLREIMAAGTLNTKLNESDALNSIDWSSAGMQVQGKWAVESGQAVGLIGPDAARALVEMHRYASVEMANAAFHDWRSSFHIRTPTFTFGFGGATKFQAGGDYYSAWRANNWVIIVRVPDTNLHPDQLRDDLQKTIINSIRLQNAQS